MTAQFASFRRGSHVSSVLAPSFPELVICASLSRQRQVQGHPIFPQAASGKLPWPAKAVRGSERRRVSPQATQVHTGPGSPRPSSAQGGLAVAPTLVLGPRTSVSVLPVLLVLTATLFLFLHWDNGSSG